MKRRASGGATRLVKKRTTLPTKQRSKHAKDISNGNVTKNGMNKPKRCITCKHFLSRAYRHRNCYRCARRLKKLARELKPTSPIIVTKNNIDKAVKIAGIEIPAKTTGEFVKTIRRTVVQKNKDLWVLNGRVYCVHKNYDALCKPCAGWVGKNG